MERLADQLISNFPELTCVFENGSNECDPCCDLVPSGSVIVDLFQLWREGLTQSKLCSSKYLCIVYSLYHCLAMGCTSSCLSDSAYDYSDTKGGALTPVTVVDEMVVTASSRNHESFSARVHNTTRKLEDDYIVEKSKVIGSGYSGPVRLGTSRLTKKKAAIKSFTKKMLTPKRLEFLRNEVSVYLLMDHPNIARLMDVYEDDQFVHIVMEYCAGRELYHRLVKKTKYSEQDAARTTYEMLLAINYLHQHNVVHRDIKLENFLYEDTSEDAKLKLIDFGFAKVFQPDELLVASCGSVAYVAPEVLKGNYNSQCDLWSMGVIVYMLLAGEPPFEGMEDDLLENIQRCNYSFDSSRWRKISGHAKDFIRGLLVKNTEKRMSATQALNHPWITAMAQHEEVEVPIEVLRDLRDFAMGNHLRRAALSMLAYTLTSDEISELHEVFLSIDNNKEGTIQLGELVEVMRGKLAISDEEVAEIFGKLDRSHQGKIEYTTFLAATMASRMRLHEDLIRHVFNQLDADRDGLISLDDLKVVLGSTIDGSDIRVILDEADSDGDGLLDFDEFERAFKMTDPIVIRDDDGLTAFPSDSTIAPPPLISLDRQQSVQRALAKLRAVSALSKAAKPA